MKSEQGSNLLQVHKLVLIEFWREFGENGSKQAQSSKSKQETLKRLKEINQTVSVGGRGGGKLRDYRGRFNKNKYTRHNLTTHKLCFACGQPARLRHHIISIGRGGLNSKRNLVSLCDSCHRYIHPWL